MKRTNLIAGIILSLLLIGGLTVNIGAQQTNAPTAPQGDSNTQQAQPQPPPSSNNTKIETHTVRTERVIEPSTFLGVDANVAMMVGAVLVVVVVIGMVAMSRRGDEVHHTN